MFCVLCFVFCVLCFVFCVLFFYHRPVQACAWKNGASAQLLVDKFGRDAFINLLRPPQEIGPMVPPIALERPAATTTTQQEKEKEEEEQEQEESKQDKSD